MNWRRGGFPRSFLAGDENAFDSHKVIAYVALMDCSINGNLSASKRKGTLMANPRRIELLKRLTLAPGISGFEREIRDIMKSQMGASALVQKDPMGSITFEFKGTTDKP